ncbi:thiamine diphosphokinase [Shimia biformata]|uniref:thiamine diphosphokinase n=1 Tax=Shimia biformata TaxID=1294299 RepID=UPI0019528ACE|nr:thiamine diphosphokinase [Shimia biformata]
MTVIVHSSEPISLVGAGIVAANDLELALAHAPRVVAADGGGAICLDHGIMPEAVIGDMDSSTDLEERGLDSARIHLIPEQETTDFDKALRGIAAPLVIGVGFAGARIDHQLACFNVLVRHPDRRCVLLCDSDIVFLAPPSLSLELDPGSRFSLYPLGLVEAVSDGLRWPVGGISFTPDGRIGTSNEVDGPVSLTVTAPKMLVILPRAALPQVVAALTRQPATWPAL